MEMNRGAVSAGALSAEQLTAELQEARSEFAIISRACGNWHEWPDGTVSESVPDYTHQDWKAATRAILERNELRAMLADLKALVLTWRAHKEELYLPNQYQYNGYATACGDHANELEVALANGSRW